MNGSRRGPPDRVVYSPAAGTIASSLQAIAWSQSSSQKVALGSLKTSATSAGRQTTTSSQQHQVLESSRSRRPASTPRNGTYPRFPVSVYPNWAESLVAEHRPEEAIEKCQGALELDSKDWRASWHWGDALARQGKLTEALEKYEQTLTMMPKSQGLQTRIAEVKKQLGQ